MSDNPTADEVRASIVPKSDQLNADDLLTGPLTVTITAVKRGNREQPIIVEIEGQRPYKPCKSMRRVLIAAFSDDPQQWVGKQATLFCDPSVTWAGVKVGGIRISHLSGLQKSKTFLLTHARGKRAEYTIQPLIDKPKYTDKLGWKGLAPEKRASAIQGKFQPLFEAKDLAGMQAKLAKLDEIATDFPPADLEELRDAIKGLIATLEKDASDGDTTEADE